MLHCLRPSDQFINPQMAGGGRVITSCAFLVISFSRMFLTEELHSHRMTVQDSVTNSELFLRLLGGVIQSPMDFTHSLLSFSLVFSSRHVQTHL